MRQLPEISDADQTFLKQFEVCEIPLDHWTHRSHVRVAYLYLRQHDFNEALTRIRAGLKAYVATNNVPDSPTSGYNETTTHAFLHLVAAMMNAYEKVFPVTDSEVFCDTHPQLLSKHVLRFFYSPAQRMHPSAKVQFVEPDLAPLPQILGS